MKQKITFLGLGLMGSHMAANLAKQGYEVTGWNRSCDRPEIQIAATAGVKVASNLQNAVAEAKLIFLLFG